MAAQAESVQSENVAICDRCDYVGTITTGTCCERCTAELPTKATRSVVCFRCKNIWKRLYECKVTGDESCAMCFAEMHSCKLCGSHIDGKHHPREDLCNQCRSVEIAIDSFLEDGEEQVATPSSELNLAECQTITRILFVTQFTNKDWWGNAWTHPGDLHDYQYTGKDHGMRIAWDVAQAKGYVDGGQVHKTIPIPLASHVYSHPYAYNMSRVALTGLRQNEANYSQYGCLVTKLISERTTLIEDLCEHASLSGDHGGELNYQQAKDDAFTGDIAISPGLEKGHQAYFPLQEWAPVQVSLRAGQVEPGSLHAELVNTVTECTRMATMFMASSLSNASYERTKNRKKGIIPPQPSPNDFKPKITIRRQPHVQHNPANDPEDDTPYPSTTHLRWSNGQSSLLRLKDFTIQFEYHNLSDLCDTTAPAPMLSELFVHPSHMPHEHETEAAMILSEFLEACVHLHLDIYWRTAQMKHMKEQHRKQALWGCCRSLREQQRAEQQSASGQSFRDYRDLYLWFTISRPADALAEDWQGRCLFNYITDYDRRAGITSSCYLLRIADGHAIESRWTMGWTNHRQSDLQVGMLWPSDARDHHKRTFTGRIPDCKALESGRGIACYCMLSVLHTMQILGSTPPGSLTTNLKLKDYVIATGCCRPGYAMQPRTAARVWSGDYYKNGSCQVPETRDMHPPEAMNDPMSSMVPNHGLPKAVQYNCDTQPHVLPEPCWNGYLHSTLRNGQLDLHSREPEDMQTQIDILKAGEVGDHHDGTDYAKMVKEASRPGYSYTYVEDEPVWHEAFSYVVDEPLNGPVAGSGKGSKDPLNSILPSGSKRSTRNQSVDYVEDPDEDVDLEDGFEGEEGLDAASDGAPAEVEHPAAEETAQASEEPTILYVCATGTVYTMDSDYQPVEVGNHLTDKEAMVEIMPTNMQLEQLIYSYDEDNYADCREAHPHDLFPPCTSCFGALQDQGNICRLDGECPLAGLDDTHMCPDCSSSLAACHAQSQSATECPEPTRVAVRLHRILWGMAVQENDPRLFFNHYPDRHATDQAWAFDLDSIRATFVATSLPDEELESLLLTHTTDIEQYSIISEVPDNRLLVRIMGGRCTMPKDNVDDDLLQEYNENRAALARASPKKANQFGKSPSAEQAREHFNQKLLDSPARKRREQAKANWKASVRQRNTDASAAPVVSEREAALIRENIALKARQTQPQNNTQPSIEHTLALLTASFTKANTDLVHTLQEARTPEPSAEGLISPHAARTTADLYADLLESLDMADHVLSPKPRPPLHVLIDTAGCNPAYPYHQRKGSILALMVHGYMDANMVNDEFIQRERDSLKASTVAGSEGGLTIDKNGLLIASQGGKPVLPRAQLRKIKTYEEWYLATDNLCRHLTATGKHRDSTMLDNHRSAMRILWIRKHTFEEDHENFLKFEQDLRSTRVSAPNLNADWLFDEDNRHEQAILNKYLLAVTSKRVNATLSSRPPRSPGEDAGKTGKCQAEGCNKRPAGRGKKLCRDCAKQGSPPPYAPGTTPGTPKPKCADYTKGSCNKGAKCPLKHADDYASIPQEFSKEVGKLQPAVCRAFAYTGRCGKSTGGSCQSSSGNTLRHTCVKCFFKEGEHSIKDGSCPHK